MFFLLPSLESCFLKSKLTATHVFGEYSIKSQNN